jgi:hypothetical protein
VVNGIRYLITPEESIMSNAFICRKPNKEKVVGDIISVSQSTGDSTYLNIKILKSDNGVLYSEVSVNISELRVYLTFSLSSLFMALGVETHEEMLRYVTDDPAEADLFYLLISGRNPNSMIDATRTASDTEQLFNSIKGTLTPEQLEVFKKLNWSSFIVQFNKGIICHITSANEQAIKLSYIGSYIRRCIRVWMEKIEPDTRYAYCKKTCATVQTQVKKAVRCSIVSFLNQKILHILSKILSDVGNNKTKPHVKKVMLKAEPRLIANINASTNFINKTILLRIQKGQSYTNEKTTMGKINRDIKSYPEDDKSMYDSLLNDNIIGLKIRDDLRNLTKHEIKKRSLTPDAQGFFDLSYTPEAPTQKVCTIRQLSSVASIIVTEPYDLDKIKTFIQQKKWLSPIKSRDQFYSKSIYAVSLNYTVLGFTENPVNAFKELRNDKRLGKIHNMCSVIIDVASEEISIVTEIGRLAVLVFVLDQTKKQSILMKEEDMQLPVDLLLEKGLLFWLTPQEMPCSVLLFSLKDYVHHGDFFLPSILANSLANNVSIGPLDKQDGIRKGITTNQIKKALTMQKGGYDRCPIKNETTLLCTYRRVFDTNFNLNEAEGSAPILMSFSAGINNGCIQEDSCELGKQACEEGLLECNRNSVYKIHLQKNQVFTNPNLTGPNQMVKYNKLGPNGWAIMGTIARQTDILITVFNNTTKQMTHYTWDEPHIGRVNSVGFYTAEDKTKILTLVVTYSVEILDGDKMWIPNVCKTICVLLNSSELLVTATGKVVTCNTSFEGMMNRFNMNPQEVMHDQAKSLKHGKTNAERFEQVDLSIRGEDDDSIVKYLINFEFAGYQTLIDPSLDIVLKKKIPTAFVTIYRMKQLPRTKAHFKSAENPDQSINPETQQTRAGRSSNGGTRHGYLELFANTGLGDISSFNERLYTNGDGKSFYYCSTCGTDYAIKYGKIQNICSLCGVKGNVGRSDTSYMSSKITGFMGSMGTVFKKIPNTNY